ncbi:nucleotidyltransferase domain-containing protein [Candidatus Shapirobacteria bacterium]|nr:nucleotidyltransferase domain-containing protein [Candidatus Shapirobacteria bacterium]
MSPVDYYSLLRKYAKEVEKGGVSVAEMYFFGSRAKGDEKKGSDMDVCVVSSDFTGDKVEDIKKLYKLAKNVSLLIEPHSFLPEEFDDKYNFLAQEIKRTGIKIV